MSALRTAILHFSSALAMLLLTLAQGFACGAESDCMVEGGSYRIRMPPRSDGEPIGAIVYFHGWQGNATEGMMDQPLTEIAARLGVAVIAPTGEGRTWSFPSSPRHYRDEFAFVDAVLKDVTTRFPIDRKRLLATGFSQGASMVWYLACRMPDRFAAFAPVAGAFWLPAPDHCEGPVPTIFHLHGLADTTVPMTGRTLSSGLKQGDVRASFVIRAPSCPLLPESVLQIKSGDGLEISCERSGLCNGNTQLELCLHRGGHEYHADWVDHAWKAAVKSGLLR